MKKLIITVASIAVAAGVNAAAMQWGNMFGTYEDVNGDAFTGGTALLYVLAGDSSTAVAYDGGSWKLNGATLVASSAYDSGIDGWGVEEYTDVGSSVSAGTYWGDDMQYFSLVIVDKDGVSSLDGYDGNYIIYTDQGTQAVVEPSGPTWGVDFSFYNDIAATDWQSAAAVPEPTSGLLLLLGMAGLALKRKKA